MSDVLPPTPEVLLARSAKLKLFAVLRRTRDPGRLRATVSEHLQWMIGVEKTGRIFMSGPIKRGEGGPDLDGLSIVRAESAGEAEALIRADPFVSAGIVDIEICEWLVNEGGIPLMLTLSDSTVTFR